MIQTRIIDDIPEIPLSPEQTTKLHAFFAKHELKIDGYKVSIPPEMAKKYKDAGIEPPLPILWDPRIENFVWTPDLTKEAALELRFIVAKYVQQQRDKFLRGELMGPKNGP